MAKQPEPEAEEAAPAKSHSALKDVTHYALMGAGPLLALVALVFAIISISRINPLQAELGNAETRIKKLGTDLAAAQVELKNAKDALQREKAARENDNRKQDELATRIVQNLAPVQKKLKFTPTLEEQLQPASSVPVAATAAPAPAAPAQPEKPHSPQVKGMLDAIKKFNAQ